MALLFPFKSQVSGLKSHYFPNIGIIYLNERSFQMIRIKLLIKQGNQKEILNDDYCKSSQCPFKSGIGNPRHA